MAQTPQQRGDNPAFPVGESGYSVGPCAGLTVREYIAVQVYPRLIDIVFNDDTDFDQPERWPAKLAGKLADALLEELARPDVKLARQPVGDEEVILEVTEEDLKNSIKRAFDATKEREP